MDFSAVTWNHSSLMVKILVQPTPAWEYWLLSYAYDRLFLWMLVKVQSQQNFPLLSDGWWSAVGGLRLYCKNMIVSAYAIAKCKHSNSEAEHWLHPSTRPSSHQMQLRPLNLPA